MVGFPLSVQGTLEFDWNSGRIFAV
jgi:hypothetical protein